MSFCAILLSLTTALLEIGGHPLHVEIASTEEERSTGLSHRSAMAENSGMLFVYDKPQILSFWMKDTSIPLSIAFFDRERRLVHVETMDPPKKGQPIPTSQSKKPCSFALEVKQGWFEKHGIGPGIQFTLKEQ